MVIAAILNVGAWAFSVSSSNCQGEVEDVWAAIRHLNSGG